VILFKPHKRRREIAVLRQALLAKHPTETVYVAWDNATTHEDDDVEAVVWSAAGRRVLLSLPTYSPWLNPIEMLWRHFRREVTHGELFESPKPSSPLPKTSLHDIIDVQLVSCRLSGLSQKICLFVLSA
jgi:transposase